MLVMYVWMSALTALVGLIMYHVYHNNMLLEHLDMDVHVNKKRVDNIETHINQNIEVTISDLERDFSACHNRIDELFDMALRKKPKIKKKVTTKVSKERE